MAGKQYISGYCSIENNTVKLNGQDFFNVPDAAFAEFAKQLYRHLETDYPKFFKMDNLSKLSFLAAELLLKDGDNENTALLFANASSSLDTDVKFNDSISDKDNYFPSPAVFVYTLPNICLGEISIKHKLYTENSFFIFDAFNPEFFANYAAVLLNTDKAAKVLCGWVEFLNDEYKAFMYLVSDNGTIEHTPQNIQTLYLS
ncbi:3-oxoacyl-ACP synthase [Flavobacterium alkalisoli]|uniref:3-oxoacyl-ACP synthase n=1 Tax=Flavobacterium alkalisoli TaxID=2602769 RepID=A0A5B9FNL7_9FLAO|nr:3-oxoacyl-ACP synthase [Flavobacterium alkalisoli]QEE48604.1 3-oxoacyl-ACP synthase [Flavobacterium alkalisoli]